MPKNPEKRPVIIESPYAGKNPTHYRRNIAYLHRAIQDCLKRGELPYASHGFFPGALDDNDPEQRKQGIEAGFEVAELFARLGGGRVFYVDRGTSFGMQEGLLHADRISMPRIDRKLGPEWAVDKDPPYCDCEHSIEDREGSGGVCGKCGVEFETVTLPKEAIAVARAWLAKKA